MTRRYVFGWLSWAAVTLAVGQAMALEIIPGEPEIDEMETAREPVVPSVEPLATGRVVAVDSTAGRIVLEFRPIPQLFLEGGTRIFQVDDPASLKGVAPGDKVRFAVGRNGRTYTVTHIENSN